LAAARRRSDEGQAMATKLDSVKADIDRVRSLSRTLTIETLHQDVQVLAEAIEHLCDVVEKLLQESDATARPGGKA
jgi:hypothetical protein